MLLKCSRSDSFDISFSFENKILADHHTYSTNIVKNTPIEKNSLQDKIKLLSRVRTVQYSTVLVFQGSCGWSLK